MDSRVATDFSKLPSHCLVTRFLNQLNSSQCYSCIATSFCKTEMVEISCPYHPCALCPGAFQQGGSNAPERQCNSQRPPEATVFPVSPGGFDSVPQILHLGPISRQTQPVTVQTDTRNMMKHVTICHTVNPVSLVKNLVNLVLLIEFFSYNFCRNCEGYQVCRVCIQLQSRETCGIVTGYPNLQHL